METDRTAAGQDGDGRSPHAARGRETRPKRGTPTHVGTDAPPTGEARQEAGRSGTCGTGRKAAPGREGFF